MTALTPRLQSYKGSPAEPFANQMVLDAGEGRRLSLSQYRTVWNAAEHLEHRIQLGTPIREYREIVQAVAQQVREAQRETFWQRIKHCLCCIRSPRVLPIPRSRERENLQAAELASPATATETN